MSLMISASKSLALDTADATSKSFYISGLTFTNNSPSSGYIAWTACTVEYQGVSYSVSASNTNYTWVYWKKSAPTAFTKTNSFPTLAADEYIVAINSSGTAVSQWAVGQTVNAKSIYAADLSAISANLGTITAGTVTGATIQTATSGQRIVINSTDGLRSFDSSGNVRIQIPVSGYNGNIILSTTTAYGSILFGTTANLGCYSGLVRLNPTADSTYDLTIGTTGYKWDSATIQSNRITLIRTTVLGAYYCGLDINPSGSNDIDFFAGTDFMCNLSGSGFVMESGCNIDGYTNLVTISANVLKCNTLQVGTYESGGTSVSGGIWVNDKNGNAYKLAVIA